MASSSNAANVPAGLRAKRFEEFMIRILEIREKSQSDGPGCRSVAVFKGCSLACAWCPSPESIDPGLRVRWNETACLGCGACVGACAAGALSLSEEGVWIEQPQCVGCSHCVAACPASSMEPRGYDYDVKTLFARLMENRADWSDGGGVTLSGGEALLQSDAIQLMRLLKSEGISIAIRTNGLVPNYRLLRTLGFADTVLFGLKIMDTVKHRQFTGQGNELILSNLKLVSDWSKTGGLLWAETPVVPDATDSADNIAAIGEYLHKLGGVERWILTPLDPAWNAAYERIYLDWAYRNAPRLTEARKASLLSVAEMTGASPEIRFAG